MKLSIYVHKFYFFVYKNLRIVIVQYIYMYAYKRAYINKDHYVYIL